MKRAPHIKMTEREFRRLKRREFKILMGWADEFQIGCAYLPREALLALCVALKEIEKIRSICKPWWGKA